MFTAVDAYDRYIGRYSPSLARTLAERAGIRAGDHVLDVGCGPGALSAHLAELVGADHVAAVDPSEAFLEACQARLSGIRTAVASAESLPFLEGEFDAALAQLVVNFMTDQRAGVGEMRRVTRAGGTVAAAVWDYNEGMTLLRAFWDAATAVRPGAQVRDERHMRFVTPTELDDLWTAVGLTDVEVDEDIVPAAYESFDDLWYPLDAGVGPAGAYVQSLDADERERLREEMRRLLEIGEGPFELTARAWVVTGRK